MVTRIIKRDGREAPFNVEKIANAIFKAAQAIGGRDYETAMDLACEVAERVEQQVGSTIPTVEQIQDMVETVKKSEEVSTAYMKIFEREEYLIHKAIQSEKANTEQERKRAEEAETRAMDAETRAQGMAAEIMLLKEELKRLQGQINNSRP